MTTKIYYTHKYDRVVQVLGMFSIFPWLILFGVIIETTSVPFIIGVVLFIGWIVFYYYIFKFVLNPFLNNLSSYMYVREILKTEISFEEVAKISWLFTGPLTWHPMTEVLKIPKENRKQYLFERAEEISRNEREKVNR